MVIRFFKHHFFISLILITVLLAGCREKEYQRVVKVGIYNNPPKIFIDHKGSSGIFIDILEYIAEKENWKIEYTQNTWSNLLKALESGEIDLLPDVAYTPERDELFDFNNVSVLKSWVQLYAPVDKTVNEPDQLNGKRIAVLADSSQLKYIKAFKIRHQLDMRIVEKKSYAESAEAARKGEADGISADRFFEFSERRKGLVATPIIFSPSNLYFAVKKDLNRELLIASDKHLSHLHNYNIELYQKMISDNLKIMERRTYFGSDTMYVIIFIAVIILSSLVILILMEKIYKKRVLIKEQNKRFKHIQKMNLLGQLAGGIAHDFNHVIGGIIGFADLILENESDNENKRMLKEIQNAAERGENLVKQILLFGRNKEPDLKKSKLKPVVDDLCNFIRPIFPPSIDIETEIATEESEVLIDPYKIHEALINLCTNSMHAIKENGRIKITLKDRKVEIRELGILGYIDPGLYRVLEISDTGTGIPEKDLSSIFEPYYSTKDYEKGTGLGLSVVFGVMEQHKGNIKISSKVGEGTAISLYFKIEDEEHQNR